MVKLLIARGARVDARDASGRTALWFAALATDLQLAHQLLAAGADPLIADAEGWSPPMGLANELGDRRQLIDGGEVLRH